MVPNKPEKRGKIAPHFLAFRYTAGTAGMAEMMASLFCLKVVSCERSQGQWLSSVPGDSRLAVKILTSSWAQGTEDWQSLEKNKTTNLLSQAGGLLCWQGAHCTGVRT